MTANSSSSVERTQRERLLAELMRPAAEGGFDALATGTLPDRGTALQVAERLHHLLLPETLAGADDPAGRLAALDAELAALEPVLAKKIALALDFQDRLDGQPPAVDKRAGDGARIACAVLDGLPDLRQHLFDDARAAFRGDPACRDPIEALYAYPGVFAVTRHRLAHLLHGLGVPLLPRLIAEHAHTITGIDIHPGASIGRAFFIDHGTGIVIGETTVIGDRVRLYQGVTLGARSFTVDTDGNLVKGQPRHPIVEDDVTIYASATVLGRVRIGRGSVIGGNVWLTHGVPAGSRVYQAEPVETGFQGGGGI